MCKPALRNGALPIPRRSAPRVQLATGAGAPCSPVSSEIHGVGVRLSPGAPELRNVGPRQPLTHVVESDAEAIPVVQEVPVRREDRDVASKADRTEQEVSIGPLHSPLIGRY